MEVGSIIGLVFLASVIVLIVYTVISDRKMKKRKEEFLNKCTQQEKDFLKEYTAYVNGKKSGKDSSEQEKE